MLSEDFCQTEEALFEGASSDIEEENWTAVQEILAEQEVLRGRAQQTSKQQGRKEVSTKAAQLCEVESSPSNPKNPQTSSVSIDSNSRSDKQPSRSLSTYSESKTSTSIEADLCATSARLAPFLAHHSTKNLEQEISNIALRSGPSRSLLTASDATFIIQDDYGNLPNAPGSSIEGSTSTPHLITKKRKGASLDSVVGRPTKLKAKLSDALVRKESKRKMAKDTEMKPEMNYVEYALSLVPQAVALQKSLKTSLFQGMVLFLLAEEHLKAPSIPITKQTWKRLNLMTTHGIIPASKFDPTSVTHVISDLPAAQTVKLLGYKTSKDIPAAIRVIKWTWFIDSINSRRLMDQLKAERFPSRLFEIEAGQQTKVLGKKRTIEALEPDESESTQERQHLSPPSSPLNGARHQAVGPDANANAIDDPLAEFIEQAFIDKLHESLTESVDETRHHASAEDEGMQVMVDESAIVNKSSVDRRKGYACKNLGQGQSQSLNIDIIQKLQELISIHENTVGNDEQWRILAYRKAISSLRRYPTRITSSEEALQIPGVGSKTAHKIMEIINTGELRRIKYAQNDRTKVCKILQGVYGVGIKTASHWYDKGIRTLEDVLQRKGGITLTEPQKIGLEVYEDLQERMPRQEAAAIFSLVKEACLKVDHALQVEMTGSYRRGSSTCGDIDILLTRPTGDGKHHGGALRKIVRSLTQQGLITHCLAEPDDWNALEAKFMGLCRLGPDATYKHRRVDILTIPHDQWGAALLYFTGDDIFNRSMRLLARHKGLSLNQRGLWKDFSRDHSTKAKVTEGTLVASKTEEEIFAALGVPWQLPHQRIRSC